MDEFVPGRQLGSYLLREKLSEGPTGILFLAVHQTTNMKVEIKILPPETTRDEASRLRARRELETLTRLNHKNIIRVWALARDGATDFLVMEHLEGRSLAQLLQLRGQLRVPDAVRFHIRALEGLAAVHAASVVHRDIYPGCLFLSGDGRVVLGGFGLARVVNPADIGELGTVLNVETMESGVFKAPEQLRGEVDWRSDLYAIGTCLYFSIAGEMPFDGPADLQLLSRLDKPPIPLKSRMPGISTAVSETIGHFVATLPTDRYTNATIAAKSLSRLL